jgi:hypothetical protein
MTYLTRLLIFTSIEEFATVLVQRGVYFYTREALGFGENANLAWSAICPGARSYLDTDWFPAGPLGGSRGLDCCGPGLVRGLAWSELLRQSLLRDGDRQCGRQVRRDTRGPGGKGTRKPLAPGGCGHPGRREPHRRLRSGRRALAPPACEPKRAGAISNRSRRLMKVAAHRSIDFGPFITILPP